MNRISFCVFAPDHASGVGPAVEPLEEKSESEQALETWANKDYEFGWTSAIEADTFAPGLNEDVIRALSAKKAEPQWLLDWRLKAYEKLQTMTEPTWPNVQYEPVDLQSISYYSAPKLKPILDSLEDADVRIEVGLLAHACQPQAGLAPDFAVIQVAAVFRSRQCREQ